MGVSEGKPKVWEMAQKSPVRPIDWIPAYNSDLPLPVPSPVKWLMHFHNQLMTGHYQNDNSQSWINNSQDVDIYLGGQHDSYNDNDDNDSIIIDPALWTQQAHSISPMLPPAYSCAWVQAVSDLQNSMSFSSSKFIVSLSPLQSTFALPPHVYGKMPDLPQVNWDLVKNNDQPQKTRLELVDEVDQLWLNLHAAQLHEIGTVMGIDAINAQMALGGMALTQVHNQLCTQEEASNPKEDSIWIIGTWGQVTTHKGFLEQQIANWEWCTAEEELAEMKAKMTVEWEKVRNPQQAEMQAWRNEKQWLALFNQRPKEKKPVELLMKDWTAKYFPDVVTKVKAAAASKGAEGNGDEEVDIEAWWYCIVVMLCHVV